MESSCVRQKGPTERDHQKSTHTYGLDSDIRALHLLQGGLTCQPQVYAMLCHSTLHPKPLACSELWPTAVWYPHTRTDFNKESHLGWAVLFGGSVQTYKDR